MVRSNVGVRFDQDDSKGIVLLAVGDIRRDAQRGFSGGRTVVDHDHVGADPSLLAGYEQGSSRFPEESSGRGAEPLRAPGRSATASETDEIRLLAPTEDLGGNVPPDDLQTIAQPTCSERTLEEAFDALGAQSEVMLQLLRTEPGDPTGELADFSRERVAGGPHQLPILNVEGSYFCTEPLTEPVTAMDCSMGARPIADSRA